MWMRNMLNFDRDTTQGHFEDVHRFSAFLRFLEDIKENFRPFRTRVRYRCVLGIFFQEDIMRPFAKALGHDGEFRGFFEGSSRKSQILEVSQPSANYGNPVDESGFAQF